MGCCACCRRPLPEEDSAFYAKNAKVFAEAGYLKAWCFECCRTWCHRCGHRSSDTERRAFADRRWPGWCIKCQESRCHVCNHPTTAQERMDATYYEDGSHNVTCERCRHPRNAALQRRVPASTARGEREGGGMR